MELPYKISLSSMREHANPGNIDAGKNPVSSMPAGDLPEAVFGFRDKGLME